MSYDSANLTTPDIKWLGLRPSDLDKYKINQQCRLPMTDEDMKMGKKLVSSLYRIRISSYLGCMSLRECEEPLLKELCTCDRL